MKHAVIFFASLVCCLFGFSQSGAFGKEDTIRIIAAKDSLVVKFKDKSIRVNQFQGLDSCLGQHIAGWVLPVAELETFAEMSADDHRAIIVILDRYRIPVVRASSIPAEPRLKFSISSNRPLQ